MKKKVLLSGKNTVIIDEFFYNLVETLECQTTSTRIEDISCHVKYFQPDIYIYCVRDESKEMIERLVSVFKKVKEQNVFCGIVGDSDVCQNFIETAQMEPDIVLLRPLSASLIANKIERLFEGRDREQKEQEELAAAQKKAEEANRRKHVTVIDDDSRMLKLMKEYLHEKYDVATALNGKIAMKFLESKSTDIILLDYMMPEEDGPTVYKKIRALPEYENKPIVFLTGMSEKEKIHKVMELMPQGYLLKPIDRDRLLDTIESLVN